VAETIPENNNENRTGASLIARADIKDILKKTHEG
jgi:hypothetical protein